MSIVRDQLNVDSAIQMENGTKDGSIGREAYDELTTIVRTMFVTIITKE